MVDVGYCIDGKHGVIRNCEIHNYSDTMKYIRFERGNEIYVIQYKEIEYIIPSDIDSVSGKIIFDKDGVTEYGADGSVVMKGRYVGDKNLLSPKPMTFAEKFKEVFGYEPNKDIYICDVMNCCSYKDGCQGCSYQHNDWDEPYVKAEDIR